MMSKVVRRLSAATSMTSLSPVAQRSAVSSATRAKVGVNSVTMLGVKTGAIIRLCSRQASPLVVSRPSPRASLSILLTRAGF